MGGLDTLILGAFVFHDAYCEMHSEINSKCVGVGRPKSEAKAEKFLQGRRFFFK